MDPKNAMTMATMKATMTTIMTITTTIFGVAEEEDEDNNNKPELVALQATKAALEVRSVSKWISE